MKEKISLKQFLIRYTSIPINFIEKHLEFYDMCDNNIFGIDLEDVIKYLGIKK